MLVEFYKQKFKELFTHTPGEDDKDLETMRWLVQLHDDLEQCKGFIEAYLHLENDYARENGYPLFLLKKVFNAVIIQVPKIHKSQSGKNRKASLQIHQICETCKKPYFLFVPVTWNVTLDYSWPVKTLCDACKNGQLLLEAGSPPASPCGPATNLAEKSVADLLNAVTEGIESMPK